MTTYVDVGVRSTVLQISTYCSFLQEITINRAKQYGKTTTLYLLSELLTPEYLCIKISFEGLGNESFETTDAFCDVLLYFTR